MANGDKFEYEYSEDQMVGDPKFVSATD